MNRKSDPLAGWTCEGQTCLTDLVEDEHIAGSMPADEAENEAARQEFYARLRNRKEDQAWP